MWPHHALQDYCGGKKDACGAEDFIMKCMLLCDTKNWLVCAFVLVV